MAMTRTGIVKDERYMKHQMGAHHPESPQRLEVIYSMLKEPEMRGNFREIPVRRATRDELLLIHSPEYVDMVASTEGKEYTYLDPDTQTSEGSYEAALLAAGGLCEAISMVISKELDNAFALVRPPGHHAERSRAMGFCLFNNVAVGAKYAQEVLGLHRILVVDWDLHHGNGTQHSFEDDASVLYFSIHQYPYYPGSGAFSEAGTGSGEGYTVNVPLSVGFGDEDYIGLIEKILRPIALEFMPEVILVSAGFDIYSGDPLGGMRVTSAGFSGLTRSIIEIADICCQGRVVITLEGGYHLQGLRDSVKEVLKTLAGLSDAGIGEQQAEKGTSELDSVIQRVREVHNLYWQGLS
jgi:acetoin utilization deacetylase AcuC-like enzyme